MQEWLSRQEAALYLGFSLDKIDRLREDGELTTYRATGTSRAVRLKRSELDSLMQPDEIAPTPAGEIRARVRTRRYAAS